MASFRWLLACACLFTLVRCSPTQLGPVVCETDSDCPLTSACSAGVCATCEGCEDPSSTCLRATCVAKNCGTTACKSGQGCIDGACADGECLGVVCARGEACARGTCYPVGCAEHE